jgi:prolyl oligopeptidase
MIARLHRTAAALAVACVVSYGAHVRAQSVAGARLSYPKAPTSDTVDTYHGVAVPDRFRPLEDPDAPETREWIEAENKITFSYLGAIPSRPRLKQRLTELWDFEKYTPPHKEGGRYFYSYNSGLKNQSVILTADSLDAKPRVLLDPNALSADGTVALSGMSPSRDGKLLAYGLASAGSDWVEWKVRDVETGKDRDDHLKWLKFSGASWTKDNAGFYYGRFPEPKAGDDLKGANFNQALYYHKVGTPQSDDVLVFERPDHKEWLIHGDVTEDGADLIVTVRKSSDAKDRVFYKPLASPNAAAVELIDNFENEFDFVGNDGPRFWFKTDKGAPRGRLVAVDTAREGPPQFEEVIPQAEETLENVTLVGDRFLAVYLKDAHSLVKVYRLDGSAERELKLPGLGTAAGFGGKRADRETFYTFNSYTRPETVYRYDVTTGDTAVFRQPRLAFDPEDYESKQVFYRSKDGTRIPMLLSYRKGTRLDSGDAPTLLFGYGGFNIALTPTFKPPNLAWMELGGVFAVANLRGGGEYGEEWHQAGTKLRKQNVFDDFIAAAEWLVANKVTSTPRLAIEGRSNGGLLIGAVLNQRPDLFGAALPTVGVMDMLRFHKFTIGWAWVDDFGSSDDPEQFRAIRAYSPLHTIRAGACYPPTLVTTADHDDRVVPAHSFKYAATLQAAQGCDNPVLIRIYTKAGHGAGKPTAKLIDEAADKWAFLTHVLKVPVAEAR